MTNKELIERLQKFPMDAKVIVGDGPDGRPNEVEYVISYKDKNYLGLGKFIKISGGNY